MPETNSDLLKALKAIESLHEDPQFDVRPFKDLSEANGFIQVALERIAILKAHIKVLESHIEMLKDDGKELRGIITFLRNRVGL